MYRVVGWPTLRLSWPLGQARPQLWPSQPRLNCVLTGLLLKRKLTYVFYGQLAKAAVELAAGASSNETVAESTTIDLCID